MEKLGSVATLFLIELFITRYQIMSCHSENMVNILYYNFVSLKAHYILVAQVGAERKSIFRGVGCPVQWPPIWQIELKTIM